MLKQVILSTLEEDFLQFSQTLNYLNFLEDLFMCCTSSSIDEYYLAVNSLGDFLDHLENFINNIKFDSIKFDSN